MDLETVIKKLDKLEMQNHYMLQLLKERMPSKEGVKIRIGVLKSIDFNTELDTKHKALLGKRVAFFEKEREEEKISSIYTLPQATMQSLWLFKKVDEVIEEYPSKGYITYVNKEEGTFVLETKNVIWYTTGSIMSFFEDNLHEVNFSEDYLKALAIFWMKYENNLHDVLLKKETNEIAQETGIEADLIEKIKIMPLEKKINTLEILHSRFLAKKIEREAKKAEKENNDKTTPSFEERVDILQKQYQELNPNIQFPPEYLTKTLSERIDYLNVFCMKVKLTEGF